MLNVSTLFGSTFDYKILILNSRASVTLSVHLGRWLNNKKITQVHIKKLMLKKIRLPKITIQPKSTFLSGMNNYTIVNSTNAGYENKKSKHSKITAIQKYWKWNFKMRRLRLKIITHGLEIGTHAGKDQKWLQLASSSNKAGWSTLYSSDRVITELKIHMLKNQESGDIISMDV